ncbi:unnamed protein product [Ranitomeya imitator]|uniref:Helix-turn-helix domain-containing protein n=1 Tax=Ranitomeya imitator TaxID=111125 RepID=A0ABN9MAV5_9NEOB|nr:unnamed protein product [Ranitomeya imitator]
MFQEKVRHWHRYIDDVFFLWLGTETECVQFLQDLNTNIYNILLTHSMSTVSATYLDLKISVEGHRLITDLFRKATATNSLLEFNSFHPLHTKVGVPISQFLRVRRNCTHDADFITQAHNLTRRFKQRGYPKRVISSAFQRARREDQASLLTSRPRNPDHTTRFITDYNNSWHQVKNIINRHWSILRTDAQTAEVTSDRPLLVTRRAPNLRDLLTSSHFSRPTVRLNRGVRFTFCTHYRSFPCGGCNVCAFMMPTKNTFFNPVDSTIHSLKHYINCKTKDVVYVIICPCGKPYVGQTSQELRKRIQKHMSTIHLAAVDQRKGKPLTPVAAHFLAVHGCSTSKTSVVGLQKVLYGGRGGNPHKLLLRIESRWIFNLRSVAPQGLNEELLFTGFSWAEMGVQYFGSHWTCTVYADPYE